MNESIISETAENLGMDTAEVEAVINEFMLQLHKAQFERNEIVAGDYLGGTDIAVLFRALPRQSFFHFLRFYEFMQRDQTGWEQGFASEFLMRLAPRSEWLPYAHQMSGWKQGKYWASR